MVEDDYVTAEDMKAELEGLGAEVLGPVPDLAGALDQLASRPAPDGAILDINLAARWSSRLPTCSASGTSPSSSPPAMISGPSPSPTSALPVSTSLWTCGRSSGRSCMQGMKSEPESVAA